MSWAWPGAGGPLHAGNRPGRPYIHLVRPHKALCARRVSFSETPTGRFPGVHLGASPRCCSGGAPASACILLLEAMGSLHAWSHRARDAVSAERVPAPACAKLAAEASTSCSSGCAPITHHCTPNADGQAHSVEAEQTQQEFLQVPLTVLLRGHSVGYHDSR